MVVLALALAALSACNGNGDSSDGGDRGPPDENIEQAVREVIGALEAKDVQGLASIMEVSEDEATGLIFNSFAGRSSDVQILEILEGEEGCEDLSDEQRGVGLTDLCHAEAVFQFREAPQAPWRNLTLLFVVEICDGRAIVSSDTELYKVRCQ